MSRSRIELDGLAKPVAVVLNANQLPRLMEYAGIEPGYIRDKIILYWAFLIILIIIMANAFKKLHPWFLLTENSSFPANEELQIMRGIMDGEDFKDISKKYNISINQTKQLLTQGMKKAGVKDLYELIVWGLRTGVISDAPIENIESYFPAISGTYQAYPAWQQVLNAIVKGQSLSQLEISSDTAKKTYALIDQKFKLGDSKAKMIRLAFAAINPISGPNKIKGTSAKPPEPFVPSAMKLGMGSLKHPPVLSKFRPANVDPNIPVYDPSTRTVAAEPKVSTPKIFAPIGTARRAARPPVRATSIQTALELLGIDRKIISPASQLSFGSFWNRPSSHLWKILELAKRRYELEIAHAHPDKPTGNVLRAQQLNSAWRIIKRMFAARGYELNTK